MNITVVGLGKIGLPLAVQFARRGHRVFGADVDAHKVELVNQGVEPFPGEHMLKEYLSEVVASGLLDATTDTSEAVNRSDVAVVAVPLFVDAEAQPDFAAIDAATAAIGRGLRSGALVCFETTLPVGTTRNRLGRILERESGMTVSSDFFLAFSPERVFTGRVFQDLRQYPKLLGGVDAASAEKAQHFYEEVLDFDPRPDLGRANGVWDLGSAEAAELAKLAETTYRDVNIGLANQFAQFAERSGIDIYTVIEACNSQPFSHIHRPGISVGGHCIPVYPRLYLQNDPAASIVRSAREVSERMPIRAVEALERAMGGLAGKTVVVLGVAYRRGVKEAAFSGVFALVTELGKRHAVPLVHDPLYTNVELQSLGFEPYRDGDFADAVILHTDHEEYLAWDPEHVPGVDFVYDGRAVLDHSRWAPVRVLTLGRPIPSRDPGHETHWSDTGR